MRSTGPQQPSRTVSLMAVAALFRVSTGQAKFKSWQIGMTSLD